MYNKYTSIYGWYGLVAGDELRILGRKDAICSALIQFNPDCITVIKEYPLFILCNAEYFQDDYRSFEFCINKADLLCVHSIVKRVQNNKLLIPEVNDRVECI